MAMIPSVPKKDVSWADLEFRIAIPANPQQEVDLLNFL
jgi:hypothetical protein